MKSRILAITIVLITAAMLFGQATTSQTPPPATGTSKSTPSGQGAGMGGMHQQHMQGMQGMQHEMQDMQANLTKMHALVAEMKTNAASMDAKNKPAMMANVQLWEMMLAHMDEMVKHMQSMQGMGPGGHDEMMHHRMHGPGPQPPHTPTGPQTTPPPPAQAPPPPQ